MKMKTMMNTNKSYSGMLRFETFEERFRYLKLNGSVGFETFGHDRYLNQALYNSREWRHFRHKVIVRDNGCDLACEGYDLMYDENSIEKIIIHHINPITAKDIVRRDPKIFDLENVVCVSFNTHNAIHYGDESLIYTLPIHRTKNDTIPWRK